MAEGFFNRFKMMIGMEEVDEEDEMEEEVVEVKRTPAAQMRPQPVAVNSHRDFSYPERSSFNQPKMEPRESKVVSMQNNGTAARQQFKLVVTEPSSFDECPKLVDGLKSRKPLIINLANLDNETAHKIFNFLSGATYALNGNVQKVANNIFVFTPDNVDVLSGTETEARSTMSIAGSPWRR